MNHSWKDPHIIESTKALIKVLYGTFAFFAIVFVVLHLAGALKADQITQNERQAFLSGLKTDTEYLKEQGNDVAKSPSLISALIAGDKSSLIAITKNEIALRNIGLMGVANSEGVILSRTFSSNIYGDNVFLTAPAGRQVGQGKAVESIELTGFSDEIFITTTRPVYNNNQMIGALFANRLLDNEYVKTMKAKYLKPSTQVVIYTKSYGVFSTTFEDPKKKDVVRSYFNSGSDWVQLGASGKIVYFEDGSSYVIENIVFPGLEASPGGALIFIPRKDTELSANIIAALATLIFFLFLAIRHHCGKKREERGWRYFVLLVVFAVPIFVIVMYSLRLQNSGRLRLATIPYTLYNSTLHLQPEWGIYNLGTVQSIGVVVETGDEAINAAQVSLSYDPSAVTVKAISTDNSDCSYFIEQTIDPKNGTVDISCVLLKKDGMPKSLRIADLIVVANKVGTYNFSFNESATKILANDGLATNVLRTSQGGSYSVDNFDLTSPNPDPAKRTFVVFSPTHPNQNRWYNIPNVNFVWAGKIGAVYRYAFDTNPTTVPGSDNTVWDTKISLPLPGDGIYYFHLQLSTGGSIAHYRVQSDQTPPTISSMNVSQDVVRVGDVARFTFDATDKASGMQKNNYVDLGNHLFLPIGSQLFIPFLYPGKQPVTLRVYDSAGNYAEKTKYITVLSKSK